MLTFFDYLRQRAFESVLKGAHEAFEVLERQKFCDKSKAQHSSTGEPSSDSPPPQLRSQLENTTPSDQSDTDGDVLLPPRRRGRPPKKRKGNP